MPSNHRPPPPLPPLSPPSPPISFNSPSSSPTPLFIPPSTFIIPFYYMSFALFSVSALWGWFLYECYQQSQQQQ